MKKNILVFLVLTFCVSLTLCSCDNSNTTSVTSISETSSINEIDSSSIANEKFATVGQVILGTEFNIALLYAKTYSELYSPTELITITPTEGKEFLVLFFDVMITDNEESSFSTSYFDADVDGSSVIE